MNQNIFQVVSEDHIDEIFDQNRQNLIVIMLSSKNCPPCKEFKPKFISLSKQYKDIFFVYIDRTNYKLTQGRYFQEFEFTPTFVFYFNKNKIADIVGVHEPAFMKLMLEIKQKIDFAREQMQEEEKKLEKQKMDAIQKLDLNLGQNEKESNPPSKESTNISAMDLPDSHLIKKKMDILNKLRELMNNGYKLSKNYNLESDYNEMLFEFQYLTQNSQMHNIPPMQKMPSQKPMQNYPSNQMPNQMPQNPPSQQPTQSNEKTEQQTQLQKKQEQIRQIQELDMLHQNMQMENYKKLQELKRMKMFKEQQDKNNNV